MVKLQPHSGHFSPVDSTIYELFRSKLYDGVCFAEKSRPDILNISENFKTLLGYKPTDVVAWKDFISTQDLQNFTEQIQNISNAEHTGCTDIRFIHKNGNVLWMQTHIYHKPRPGQKKQYIFIAFKDITDQKNHELKVTRQQQRDNDILNSSGIGTWEYNLITEKVVFNESCAKIIGYTLEELQQKENNFWDNLTHPDDLKRSRHLIKEHITQNSSGFKNEVRIKHKDGHWVWVMDIGKVLSYAEDGQPEWLGGIHYAITERKNGDLLVQRYKD
ncbi:MAG: PAS domain-containing protein, partial [Gelidibacter sp.]